MRNFYYEYMRKFRNMLLLGSKLWYLSKILYSDSVG
jgi:hypothetical protein